MRKTRWGVAAALLVGTAVAVAALGGASSDSSAATRPAIVIGWAFDSKGNMAPFDGPALAAARIHVRQINAKGGVGGRPIRIDTCDTNNNNPARAKSCARNLLGNGAHVIFVTCDVDFATPVVQEAINRGKLTIAPCIGTDQMGPKRFGRKGKLAFSFGNVAQDEGSAMAEYAIRRGWRRDEHADCLLQERRHGVREAVHAAGRPDRRARELRDRGEQRPERGQPAEPAPCGRLRHVHGVR